MGITREIVVYSCMPFKKYRWVSYATIGQIGFLVVNLFVLPTPTLMAERESKKTADGGIKIKLGNSELEFVGSESKQNNGSMSLGQKLGNLSLKEILDGNNMIENLIGRPFFSGGLIFSICFVTAGLIYRSRRAIHMITLLPHDKVRISTFSPIALGKPPTVEIPHSHVSCVQPREGGNNYAMFKIKGFRGNFVVDKSDGTFHEPKLFDEYLSYARSWAAK